MALLEDFDGKAVNYIDEERLIKCDVMNMNFR